MGALSTLLPNLSLGFSVAFSPMNLFYVFMGVFIGTVIGVLPGIGPLAAIAMLLPLTFSIDPGSSIIMLAGIYYGTKYGGSTTSILVNMPGETDSVVTCIDGFQMAKQGRAGAALAVAAIGSFVAGSFATLFIAVVGPVLGNFALLFGSPEFFSLMVMGLISAVVLAHGSMLKAIAMIFLGLLIGTVGLDINSGIYRFSFDSELMAEGFNFVVIAMGLFGFSEILLNLDKGEESSGRELLTKKIHGLMPTWADMKASMGAILRGTGVGLFFGGLPGHGPIISSLSSYALEKKMAKDASQFGKGDIRGVAGPEAANNAAAQCAFIPTLTLGIPGTSVMALMLGALIMQGIVPGPMVMTQHRELFWGLIASMWIGNAVLLILNLPLVGIWIKLLQVPYRFLFPAIMGFMAIGIYSVDTREFDIYLTIAFGIMGYAFKKLKVEVAPLILAVILGPMMEENLRRSLRLSGGDPTIFISRPISAFFLFVTVLFLISVILPVIRKKREESLAEESDD
ncbi:MAG: tripartite tricarboxylate transporter permease [Deltaproteobacteria bacterium]|nr:tripartite tricarboxylate transporter permease [Deltaproteobacteria bacterium]